MDKLLNPSLSFIVNDIRYSINLTECPCGPVDQMLKDGRINADQYKELIEVLPKMHDGIQSIKSFEVKNAANTRSASDCGCGPKKTRRTTAKKSTSTRKK